MQVKFLAGIVGAALLLAGCSSTTELTSAGQSVRFVEDKPGQNASCWVLLTARRATGFPASRAQKAVQCAGRQTRCVTMRPKWAAT